MWFTNECVVWRTAKIRKQHSSQICFTRKTLNPYLRSFPGTNSWLFNILLCSLLLTSLTTLHGILRTFESKTGTDYYQHNLPLVKKSQKCQVKWLKFSHSSSMALRMASSVCQKVIHFSPDLNTTGWIPMTFCAGIYGPQGGESLTLMMPEPFLWRCHEVKISICPILIC